MAGKPPSGPEIEIIDIGNGFLIRTAPVFRAGLPRLDDSQHERREDPGVHDPGAVVELDEDLLATSPE